MDSTLGNRIYHLRTAKRMTQDQLAEKIGVSRQALSKWERGEAYPDYYNTTALAKALEVSVDELTGEPKEAPKQDKVDDYLTKSGNFVKNLLYKAQHTTNTAEAKKIKKTLVGLGAAGMIIGGLMVLFGFIGFISGAMNSFGSFNPFNPIPFFILIIVGFGLFGISIYVLIAGLAVVVVGATTNFLDGRTKCPKCGDKIDADEMICSHCGYDLSKGINSCPKCGYDNQPQDEYCRKCGEKLQSIPH